MSERDRWEYRAETWRISLAEMNKLGAEGWELVCYTQMSLPTCLLFKRRVLEPKP